METSLQSRKARETCQDCKPSSAELEKCLSSIALVIASRLPVRFIVLHCHDAEVVRHVRDASKMIVDSLAKSRGLSGHAILHSLLVESSEGGLIVLAARERLVGEDPSAVTVLAAVAASAVTVFVSVSVGVKLTSSTVVWRFVTVDFKVVWVLSVCVFVTVDACVVMTLAVDVANTVNVADSVVLLVIVSTELVVATEVLVWIAVEKDRTVAVVLVIFVLVLLKVIVSVYNVCRAKITLGMRLSVPIEPERLQMKTILGREDGRLNFGTSVAIKARWFEIVGWASRTAIWLPLKISVHQASLELFCFAAAVLIGRSLGRNARFVRPL